MTTACTTSSILEPYDCNETGSKATLRKKGKRRHSLHHARRFSEFIEDDSVMLNMVDDFLTELEDKLDTLESYGIEKMGEGLEAAYNTLYSVRAECHRVKDEVLDGGRRRAGEVLDSGRRRAAVLVEVLESRYANLLSGRETIAAKVSHGVEFLSGFLADIEATIDDAVTREIDSAKRGLEHIVDAKDHLAESIEGAIKAARERRLITYEELPFPWRVNPYIFSGYRFTETYADCVRSAFALSNETTNIWSHALGFVIILSIAFYFYPASEMFSNHTTVDKLINGLFFLAAAKCMVCSTIWHTFSSISHQHIMERFACVDYSGISLLIAASIITTEYTAFYVDPVSRWIYISITFILGIAGMILPWKPTFNRADMRVWRVAFYVGLGATGFILMFQLTYIRSGEWTMSFYGPVMKLILVYLCGACVYAAQVPEKYFPGCFDWIGGSHNIWHACVLGGILFHWHAMNDLFHVAFKMATA
ncbi:putative IZH family channel protein [Terfezia boudieri ATCC MYA-4762]|uniref:Putative IZH family channel protein n=1 Tax=Terfezia boudieri ATCC MYA-4762 TaxID=1051890 RepID=A0A3N4LVV2_9PEZI|nr:putative IZH family channel protein [Terfezia boudieri ATCC MYA-4762]